MKLSLFCPCIILATSLCYGQHSDEPAAANLDASRFETQVDAVVAGYMDLDIFSGVVLVAEEGVPVYQKAFGLADRDRQIPNTLNTKFMLGSMNKTYTQVVVLQLIEEGKLHYTDKLVHFLPGFQQQDADKITVEHLLNHTSGFGDYHGPAFWQLSYEQKSISGLVELISQLDLMFPPGQDRAYSNAGYILLGAIIEKVTGKSYAQNVRERITQPLGLTNTYLENNASVPDRSIGYSLTIHGIEDNQDMVFEPKSDGGFWATASDVMTFYRNFFYGETLLKQSTKNRSEFFQQIKPFYDQPGRGIPLAGGMNGLNTVHLEMLKEHISIVVLANMDEPVAEKVCFAIHDILNGRAPEPAALPAVLNIYLAYQAHDVQYIREYFDSLTVNFHPTDPKDMILNTLGYELLSSGRTDEAIEIFKLNTELFPKVGNCWDSYGEALLAKGDKVGALNAYRKALELDPGIPSAREAVKQLEGH